VNRAEFDALVAPLEEYERRSPSAYRHRVVAFALLGYAFLFSTLVGILALLGLLVVGLATAGGGGYVFGKIAIPLVVLGWIVARSLWVRFPAPQGIALTKRNAPELLSMLDGLRTAVGAPRFHAVLLDAEFNASVAEIPRLGVFGWPKHYLVLGYPLLHAVTAVQLRAVIAHELGHRSGRHGRIGGWIYRVRTTWLQLLHRLEQERRAGAALYQRFFTWYAPKFQAYSFVLARSQEYEADRLAAELTSAGDVAAALTAIAVRGRFLEGELWARVKRRVALEPEAPRDLHLGFARDISAAVPGSASVPLLQAELARPTDTTDTHPSLSDRLRALGQPLPEPAALPEIAEAAADTFLGASDHTLGAQLSDQWRAAVDAAWRDEHVKSAHKRRRVEELAARAAAGALSAGEWQEQAFLTVELEGLAAARPLLEQAAAAEPGDVRLRFLLGQALAAAGDTGARDHLEFVAQADPLAASAAYQVLEGLAQESGDREAAARWHERLTAHLEMLDRAQAERQGIGPRDAFDPHGLDPASLTPLEQHLATIPEVRRAWLVRKRVSTLPELPYFGLIAEVRLPFLTLDRRARGNALLERVAAHASLPEPLWVTVAWDRSNKLLKRVQAIGPGAEIYRRGAKS